MRAVDLLHVYDCSGQRIPAFRRSLLQRMMSSLCCVNMSPVHVSFAAWIIIQWLGYHQTRAAYSFCDSPSQNPRRGEEITSRIHIQNDNKSSSIYTKTRMMNRHVGWASRAYISAGRLDNNYINKINSYLHKYLSESNDL